MTDRGEKKGSLLGDEKGPPGGVPSSQKDGPGQQSLEGKSSEFLATFGLSATKDRLHIHLEHKVLKYEFNADFSMEDLRKLGSLPAVDIEEAQLLLREVFDGKRADCAVDIAGTVSLRTEAS
jgi:hypothetical protein